MKCSECENWTPCKFNEQILPEDYTGYCDTLESLVCIDHYPTYDGSVVDTIETDHDFFCKGFKAK